VTVEEVTLLHDVNVLGPTVMFRTALTHLRESRGAVVNVSSTFGHRPAPPGAASYAASKAALEALTRSWAVETAVLGIRVNAVAPGVSPPDVHAAVAAQEHNGADSSRCTTAVPRCDVSIGVALHPQPDPAFSPAPTEDRSPASSHSATASCVTLKDTRTRRCWEVSTIPQAKKNSAVRIAARYE
jgi:NAD(P)-dependent dehydrogenase (short-subunit alcohol dehydrogenase family)